MMHLVCASDRRCVDIVFSFLAWKSIRIAGELQSALLQHVGFCPIPYCDSYFQLLESMRLMMMMRGSVDHWHMFHL